jgi:uncharacterized protein (TIGR02246 family)
MTTTEPALPQSASADEVLESMCRRYADAVNANDSAAYSRLFTEDAIRMPPGTDPEHGREDIRRGEQSDYDVARWSIRSTPVDALQISEDCIYGIAHVDAATTAHADRAKTHLKATKTWLLKQQASGDWLIARQMWNLKSKEAETA